jgi:hypothetical protein
MMLPVVPPTTHKVAKRKPAVSRSNRIIMVATMAMPERESKVR